MTKKNEVNACADCGVTGENETLVQISGAGKKSDWFCTSCMDKRFSELQNQIKSDLKIRNAAINGVTIAEKSIDGKTKQVVKVNIVFLKNEQPPGLLEKLSAQMAKGNDLLMTVGAMQLDMNIDKVRIDREDF